MRLLPSSGRPDASTREHAFATSMRSDAANGCAERRGEANGDEVEGHSGWPLGVLPPTEPDPSPTPAA